MAILNKAQFAFVISLIIQPTAAMFRGGASKVAATTEFDNLAGNGKKLTRSNASRWSASSNAESKKYAVGGHKVQPARKIDGVDGDFAATRKFRSRDSSCSPASSTSSLSSRASAASPTTHPADDGALPLTLEGMELGYESDSSDERASVQSPKGDVRRLGEELPPADHARGEAPGSLTSRDTLGGLVKEKRGERTNVKVFPADEDWVATLCGTRRTGSIFGQGTDPWEQLSEYELLAAQKAAASQRAARAADESLDSQEAEHGSDSSESEEQGGAGLGSSADDFVTLF